VAKFGTVRVLVFKKFCHIYASTYSIMHVILERKVTRRWKKLCDRMDEKGDEEFRFLFSLRQEVGS